MSQKIVEMRQAGFTWWQIDQMLFPRQTTKEETYGGKSPSYILARKEKLPIFGKKKQPAVNPVQEMFI